MKALKLSKQGYLNFIGFSDTNCCDGRAIDRVHRLGQMYPVTVKRFIMKGSVEEKMLEIQKKKSALAGAITGHGEQTITLSDLMGLFV